MKFFGENTLIIMATHQLILNIISKISIFGEVHFIIKLILVLMIEYGIIILVNNNLVFLLGKFNSKSKVYKKIVA